MLKPALVGAAAAGLGLAGAALADDAPAAPAPDKSGFILFNPTPDADLRSFCTDRPTKSTGPCTVDAGHFQVESDVFNYTADRSGGMDTDTWLVTNPTFKLGVTNTVDVELNIAPYEVITTRDRTTGAKTRLSGIGDFYAKVKVNVIGDEGGDFALAINPYIKAPTARAGIGDGAVEGGVIIPMTVNLPMNWQLTIDPEVDLLADSSGGGRHINTAGLISFSRAATKTLTLSAELWADANFDPSGTVNQYSFDLGAAWVPAKAPNFQLDGGVNVGLNNVTPGVQVYMGVSQRF